ncbi:MAG: efflux RND transporter periplasmic adaptor subunit, partial [Bryobacteraceae bacterium]
MTLEESEDTKTEWKRLEQPEPGAGKPRGVVVLCVLAVAAALLGFGIYSGINARAAARQQLTRVTDRAAAPVVNVVYPEAAAPTEEIVLPGSTQAFTDSPIYARTSGYLAHWYFDIGARVTKGQLLADIETPETDQQLQQARADLESAQANYHLAETTAVRWQDLLKSDSVSKQETDQAVSNQSAQKAMMESRAANVRRLEQLQSFEKVYAPFDGVITARNTDIGALIDAGAGGQGSGGQSKELFHLAAIGTLRVFVSVPEVYSQAAKPGAHAALTLDEFPGQIFHGTLVRNASSIDPASRTLLVEVDVDNPTGQLLPGAYVSVHLKLPAGTHRSVTIPANTLLFRREGLRAAVVRNGRAELTPVTIGRDYGGRVE